MPKRKPRKNVVVRSSRNNVDGTINFTFFNSKLFLTLVAVALIVIVLAIFSSINNPSLKQSGMQNTEQYRININTIKNDPSAQSIDLN